MPTEITPSSSDPALATYDSPIGSLTLASRDGSLVGVWVAGQRFFGRPYGIDEAVAASAQSVSSLDGCGRDAGLGRDEDAAALAAAASWLDDYFAWRVPSPARVPLSPMGSVFQLRVWEAMSAIPYGYTMTYGQLEYRLREAGHVRADRRPAARRGHPRVSPVGRRRARAQSPAPHPPLPQGRGGGRPGRLRGGRRRESLAARA